MKKILIFSIFLFILAEIKAQNKIDVKTGEEILKLLPDKVKDKDNNSDKDSNKDKDKIKEAEGFIGVVVHRNYGDHDENVNVTFINLSPSLISVNKFLNKPIINNPAQYLVTVIDGYKALIQTFYREDGRIDYELLIPMSATLLSVKSTGYSRDALIAITKTIPVAQIAKMVEK